MDIPFHGLRPSDACCVCGGGNVRATPTQLPLSGRALYLGQEVKPRDSAPEPMPEAIVVAPSCDLSSMGLKLASNGTVTGTATNVTEVSCSMSLVQDPVRGIADSVQLSFSVSPFTYGRPEQTDSRVVGSRMLIFASWGLDGLGSLSLLERTRGYQPFDHFHDFHLACDPSCPWLSVNPDSGELVAKSLEPEVFPESMRGSLMQFEQSPSCSCRVTATDKAKGTTASTHVTALQTRLWKKAVYHAENAILAQVGVEIPAVELQEALGRDLNDLKFLECRKSILLYSVQHRDLLSFGFHQGDGLRWYVDHEVQAPVVEKANGDRFVVLPSLAPAILDVQCSASDTQGTL